MGRGLGCWFENLAVTSTEDGFIFKGGVGSRINILVGLEFPSVLSSVGSTNLHRLGESLPSAALATPMDAVGF